MHIKYPMLNGLIDAPEEGVVRIRSVSSVHITDLRRLQFAEMRTDRPIERVVAEDLYRFVKTYPPDQPDRLNIFVIGHDGWIKPALPEMIRAVVEFPPTDPWPTTNIPDSLRLIYAEESRPRVTCRPVSDVWNYAYQEALVRADRRTRDVAIYGPGFVIDLATAARELDTSISGVFAHYDIPFQCVGDGDSA